jgi:flagellar basal-body rod modification protein FlgD
MTNNVSPTYSANAAGYTGQTQSSSTSSFSGDDFMKMLLAEMTNQNPLEPMSDSEMMTQYVQLNSLQQLQDIKSALSQSSASTQVGYAASLIGKTVSATVNQQAVSGVVKAVTIDSGVVKLQVDNQVIDLEDVYKIQGE